MSGYEASTGRLFIGVLTIPTSSSPYKPTTTNLYHRSLNSNCFIKALYIKNSTFFIVLFTMGSSTYIGKIDTTAITFGEC